MILLPLFAVFLYGLGWLDCIRLVVMESEDSRVVRIEGRWESCILGSNGIEYAVQLPIQAKGKISPDCSNK